MMSDEYYSSESYSESNPIPPDSSKKVNITTPKPSQPVRRPIPNPRRPIPVRSPIQNPTKTPSGKNSPPNINSGSSGKKMIQMPIDSDSGSYYESESESYDEEPHISQAISPIPPTRTQSMKPSPLISRQTTNEINSNKDTNESESDNGNNNFYGLQNSPFKEGATGFQDTDEEPQIVISEETIKSLKPKGTIAQPNKLLNDSTIQLRNENINIANSNESFSMVRSDLSESLSLVIQNEIYRVTRNKTQFSHYSYQLLYRDQCLINASSSNIKKSVEFKACKNFQGGPLDAYMKISKKRRQFCLFNNGIKIMSVLVSTVKKPLYYERFFTVTIKKDIHSENSNDEITLETMMPKKRPDGKYSMNFGGKFTKRSIKNAILINDNQQKMITVRRIGDSQLEMEVNPLINQEIIVFAFGVLSWICPY